MTNKIYFKINEKKYAFDKNELNEQLTLLAEDKLKEGIDGNPMIKSTVKSTLSMVLGIMGIHNEKGEDTFLFASKVLTEMLLNSLEGKTVEIKAEEVE